MNVYSLIHSKSFSGTEEEIVIQMKKDHTFTYNQSNKEYMDHITGGMATLDNRTEKKLSPEEDFIDLLIYVELVVLK